MSKVIHRSLRGGELPRAVGGEGVWLVDGEGRRYLDGSGGAAVSCLGHGHAAVVEAIREQVGRLAYAHTAFFTTEVLEELGEVLVGGAPGNLEGVYLVSGGSEAMEAALKLARQYFVERGEGQRVHFISRRLSYHGNTLGALAVGGNAGRRAVFEPLLMGGRQISPCYAYRGRREGEAEEAYGRRVADELEGEILRLGAEKVIGFVAEPVVGATAGAVPAVGGYFARIREICDEYGVLLILDEVMCGMGRTGALYAHTFEGAEEGGEGGHVRADLVTVAKGLGGGYQPIGAVLVDGGIVRTIGEGSGAFQHGHTYIGHAVAAAAALAVQRTIAREGLLEQVRVRGAELMAGLRGRFGGHPYVGDIRGRGLFVGLELVGDREGKTPLADEGGELVGRIRRAAMGRGLLVYPGSGTADGKRGHHILLAPPFVIGRGEVEELVERLGGALGEVFPEVGG